MIIMTGTKKDQDHPISIRPIGRTEKEVNPTKGIILETTTTTDQCPEINTETQGRGETEETTGITEIQEIQGKQGKQEISEIQEEK